MDKNLETIINRILYIILIGLAVQIYLSYNLWVPIDRTYPLIGFWEGLAFGNDLTVFFTYAFMLGLAIVAVFPKIRFWGFLGVFPFAVLLIVEDTTRLQIWFYIYLTLLAVIAWAYWQNRSEKTLHSMQFAIALVYCWTGVQKLNPFFIEDVYKWLVKIFEWTAPLAEIPVLGYTVGLFELWIDLGLLFPKTRKLAIFSAIALHIMILVLLVSDGFWNTIVYPWNIVMVALIVVLFWKEKRTVWQRQNKPHLLLVFLFGFFPLLDLFGLGIHQLSFGMYSGAEVRGYVYLEDGDAVEYCILEQHWNQLLEQSATESALSIDRWASTEMNAPSIGGYRVLYIVAKKVCACPHRRGKAGGLEVKTPHRWTGGETTKNISCKELLSDY